MKNIEEGILKFVLIRGEFSALGYNWNNFITKLEFTDKKERTDLEKDLKKRTNFWLKQIGFECKVSIQDVRDSLEIMEENSSGGKLSLDFGEN